MDRTYLKILKELEYPPTFLIPIEQFEYIEGVKLKDDYGISSIHFPVFALRRKMRGRVKENVIYHEIGHLLFPHRPEWWIEAFGEKMARGGGKGYYCAKFGHSVDDLPSRSRLLELARRASRRRKL